MRDASPSQRRSTRIWQAARRQPAPQLPARRPTPDQALLGGALGFGIFLLLALIGRGAMGLGDVKLAGVIGLMTGYPLVVAALALGIVLGGVAAIALLVTRRAGRKGTMAYAPYLALGTIVVLLL